MLHVHPNPGGITRGWALTTKEQDLSDLTDLSDETCRDAPKHDTRGLSNLTFGVLQ